MVVVSQGSHEPVAETGLADAHGSFLSLPSGQSDHAYCEELAGAAYGSRVSPA